MKKSQQKMERGRKTNRRTKNLRNKKLKVCIDVIATRWLTKIQFEQIF
jgi:hypothetical protein